MIWILFLLSTTSASIADNECAQGLDKLVKGFGNLAEAAFGTDIYASMVYYSGKDFNDLGNYHGCNELNGARYVLLDATKTFGLVTVIGWCLPAACTKNEIEYFFQGIMAEMSPAAVPTELDMKALRSIAELAGFNFNSLKSDVSLPFEVVFPKEEQDRLQAEYGAGTIIMILVWVVLGILLIWATGLDLYQTHLNRRIAKIKAKGEGTELSYTDVLNASDFSPIKTETPRPFKSTRLIDTLMCFSMYSNANKIFTRKDKAEPLDILNGVRVMAMCNVILGHQMQFRMGMSPSANINGLYREFEDPALGFVYAGFYAVDTFFWMTGTLTGYLLLKEIANRRGQLNWGLVYFHRAWRLLPALAFTLFFIWAFLIYMGNGPRWYQATFVNKECPSYWWTNLLFVNNFIPANAGLDRCMAWSWYLSNDMQFFMITPIILYLYYKYARKVGWTILGLLILCTVLCCSILVGVNDYSVVPFDDSKNGGKFDMIYNKPYCRVAAFAIGLGCGWVLYSYYRYKETKEVFDNQALAIAHSFTRIPVVRYVGFILGVGLISFVIFIQHSAYADIRNGFQNWNRAETVLFMGFDKVLYGLGLSLTLMPCLLGKFPYLIELMGAAMWAPLAKISYCAYLIHILILGTMIFSAEVAWYWSPLDIAIEYIAAVVLSYAAAFVLSLCVEAPFMNIEKVLFAKKKPSTEPLLKNVGVN